MKKRNLFPIAIILALFLISFREDLFQVSKNLDIFASLYKEININYVEETDPSAMMRTGIDAMLKGLDPYTDYVPESEIESYKLKFVSTQYGGIGASTIFLKDKLYISDVSENNPANKEDLRPGDEIVKINGLTIKGKDRTQISQLIRGPKGSAIDLELVRDGASLNKKIIRQEIKQANVSYSGMLANGFGYIKLNSFLENSAQEVKNALDTLNKQNPKGLILDLRDNGGGILGDAIRIINFFVAKDIPVLNRKARNPERSYMYRTDAEPMFPDLPLVILINKNSASASEVVSGTLQDLDRAVVIGQRSFGKGLVQQTFNLPYNSLVKVTVAKYYTPSGRCIQALDYAHRDKNGSVSKFADSISKPFSTKIGRTVFSDNGVYPDVYLPEEKINAVTIALANQYLFFDFTNSYQKTHKTIAPASSFKISDADYNQFVTSIEKKGFTYTLQSENLLAELGKQAEKESKTSAVKEDIERLKTKIEASKKSDLTTYKNEIKRFLETQIVGRYYYEKGRAEQSFQYDKDLFKAQDLLKNPALMASILKGEGAYKIIGKPGSKETASAN